MRISPIRRFTEAELRRLYDDQQLSSRAIARIHGCHKSAVLTAMVAYGITRRPPRFDPIYPRRPFSDNPLEKAYLTGFRDGDLHVHKANYHETSQTITIACASTKQDQINLISSLFEAYGRVHVSATTRQSVITCLVDLSFSFLLHKSDHLPEWIAGDRYCFAAYFAGYVDAEAYIGVKKATRASQLVVRSGDVGILADCQVKLVELGIDCPPITLLRSVGQRDGINGPIYRRDYWCLAVYQQRALYRLFESISPYMRHRKRRTDMEHAWENLRQGSRLERSSR